MRPQRLRGGSSSNPPSPSVELPGGKRKSPVSPGAGPSSPSSAPQTGKKNKKKANLDTAAAGAGAAPAAPAAPAAGDVARGADAAASDAGAPADAAAPPREHEVDANGPPSRSYETIAASPEVKQHLKVAIRRGIEDKGMEALRQAMAAAGIDAYAGDPRQLFEPIMTAYVHALTSGSKAEVKERLNEMEVNKHFAADAKRALKEQLLYLDLGKLVRLTSLPTTAAPHPPIVLSLLSLFTPSSLAPSRCPQRKLAANNAAPNAASTEHDFRQGVFQYFREHVKPVIGCVKCTTTRDSQEVREAYTSEGGSGKASNPLTKRACCLWEHSLSAAQLAEKAMTAFSGLKKKKPLALQLAKEFMSVHTTPLGTLHATDPKLDYQVTLYGQNDLLRSGRAFAVNTGGKLVSQCSHYFVYMGYYWHGAFSTYHLPLTDSLHLAPLTLLPLTTYHLPLTDSPSTYHLRFTTCHLPILLSHAQRPPPAHAALATCDDSAPSRGSDAKAAYGLASSSDPRKHGGRVLRSVCVLKLASRRHIYCRE